MPRERNKAREWRYTTARASARRKVKRLANKIDRRKTRSLLRKAIA